MTGPPGFQSVIFEWLASILKTVRPDVKIMANYLLSQILELHGILIFVDPFKRRESMHWNLRPLRESIEWLKTGGVLVKFPAGEVSHIRMEMRQVTDPEWSTSVARIVRRTAAPVLPMFFRGSNGHLFQTPGLVHPRTRNPLRTVTPTGWNPGSLRRMIRDIDDLSEWISEVEPDGKGVPILLRHYLNWAAGLQPLTSIRSSATSSTA
jgi:hypothetical protein